MSVSSSTAKDSTLYGGAIRTNNNDNTNNIRMDSSSPALEAQSSANSPSSPISKYELPPLPFHLREHRLSVLIVTFIMFVDHGVLPPGLYFALAYCTNLSNTTIFAIVTSVFGIVLGVESCWRIYKLLQKNPQYRPEDACRTRWHFWRAVDFMQLSLPLMLIINVVFVVVGTSINPPLMRLLALPMPLITFNISWQLLGSLYLYSHHYRAPMRMSSTLKGERFPMYLSLIIEDIVAVDLNGKLEWRKAWNRRYKSSFVIRRLIRRLTLFWGIGGMCIAAITLGLLFGIKGRAGREAGYAIGWLLPWVWIVPSVFATTIWVKTAVAYEQKAFVEQPELFPEIYGHRS